MINYKLEKYNKDNNYSFALGAFPTFELLKNKPQQVECVLLHSKLNISEDIEKLIGLCKKLKVQIINDDKIINKIVDKGNCFVVGVFKKFENNKTKGNHLTLVNPSDAGNLGTIMRSMLGFGITNLNIVRPAVDVFNPKVVRASMGAIFSLNINYFDSLEEYIESNTNQKFFFMLDGKRVLGKFQVPNNNFDIVFGNEATGLPTVCHTYGESVVIEHSNKIDSLNLPISVGVALYEFMKK